MAFVVEDGTGLETANAYISVAFMRAYWADVGVTFAQADSVLQVAIVKATRYVDLRYGHRWLGCAEFATVQALAWPRLYVYQPCSCEYYTGVPLPLQKAVAEYSQRALTAELLPDPTSNPFITKVKEKVGPIETEEERIPGQILFGVIPAADFYLRYLVQCNSYVYR